MFYEPKVQLELELGALGAQSAVCPPTAEKKVCESVVTSRSHNAYRPIAAAARGRHTRSPRTRAQIFRETREKLGKAAASVGVAPLPRWFEPRPGMDPVPDSP